MARPFDGSLEWWREELWALAQIVHQGHTAQGGTWQNCPMASCARFRAVMEESGSSEAELTNRWALKRALTMVKRSRKLSAIDVMHAEDLIRTVCFEQAGPTGDETGDVCP